MGDASNGVAYGIVYFGAEASEARGLHRSTRKAIIREGLHKAAQDLRGNQLSEIRTLDRKSEPLKSAGDATYIVPVQEEGTD